MNQLPVLDFEAGMIDCGSVEGLNSGVRALVHEAIASAIEVLI
ncbi:MAG TPA: hypothetical protein VEZ20_09320 [Allosphingosinicella sp.]|nr:hypothetical protein [Allosphingosinicella sp.]